MREGNEVLAAMGEAYWSMDQGGGHEYSEVMRRVLRAALEEAQEGLEGVVDIVGPQYVAATAYRRLLSAAYPEESP